MPRVHTVQDGEHLSAIAARYGFQSPTYLWNHRKNAPLRARGRSPDVLLPGDEVFVPDFAPKSFEIATGAAHSFTVRVAQTELRLRLRDATGRAREGAALTLVVQGARVDRTADGDGAIDVPVPRDVDEAVLVDGEVESRLRVGALDPVSETTGWHARLVNLGYLVGAPAEMEPQARLAAIEEFQLESGVAITGLMDDATMAKLVEVHGA